MLFAEGDVGKRILVEKGINEKDPLDTAIAEYISPTEVRLAAPAQNTVVERFVKYGASAEWNAEVQRTLLVHSQRNSGTIHLRIGTINKAIVDSSGPKLLNSMRLTGNIGITWDTLGGSAGLTWKTPNPHPEEPGIHQGHLLNTSDAFEIQSGTAETDRDLILNAEHADSAIQLRARWCRQSLHRCNGLHAVDLIVPDVAKTLLLTDPLAAAEGGTGLASYTKGDLIVATSAAALARLLPVGANGFFLMADSTQDTGIKWGSLYDITNAKFKGIVVIEDATTAGLSLRNTGANYSSFLAFEQASTANGASGPGFRATRTATSRSRNTLERRISRRRGMVVFRGGNVTIGSESDSGHKLNVAGTLKVAAGHLELIRAVVGGLVDQDCTAARNSEPHALIATAFVPGNAPATVRVARQPLTGHPFIDAAMNADCRAPGEPGQNAAL